MKCIGIRKADKTHLDCVHTAKVGGLFYGHAGNLCGDCVKVYDAPDHDRDDSAEPWKIVESTK